jgi:hypothetical protein
MPGRVGEQLTELRSLIATTRATAVPTP